MYFSVNTINWKLRNSGIIFSLGTGHCEMLSPARKSTSFSPWLRSRWKSIWLREKKVSRFDDVACFTYCGGQRVAKLDKSGEGLDYEGQLHFLR